MADGIGNTDLVLALASDGSKGRQGWDDVERGFKVFSSLCMLSGEERNVGRCERECLQWSTGVTLELYI